MSIDDQNEKGTGLDQEEAEEVFKEKFRQKFGAEPTLSKLKLRHPQMNKSGQVSLVVSPVVSRTLEMQE